MDCCSSLTAPVPEAFPDIPQPPGRQAGQWGASEGPSGSHCEEQSPREPWLPREEEGATLVAAGASPTPSRAKAGQSSREKLLQGAAPEPAGWGSLSPESCRVFLAGSRSLNSSLSASLLQLASEDPAPIRSERVRARGVPGGRGAGGAACAQRFLLPVPASAG